MITAKEMEALINKSLEKAGIDLEADHAATMERHKEIMELIDKADREQKEAREKSNRQMMDAQDVAEALSVSKSIKKRTWTCIRVWWCISFPVWMTNR